MKVLTGAVLALLFALVRPPIANVAEVEPFGMISGSIGAERETGQPNGNHGIGRPGIRGSIQALGVLPFAWQNFGLQGSAQYTGGGGGAEHRFGATAGPIYGFSGGKTGLILEYQHRTVRDANFFWLNPVLALYFDQMNLDIAYSQPISSIQRKNALNKDPDKDNDDLAINLQKRDIPVNKLQASVSYFPAMDLPYVKRDNLELTFGVQVNTFVGPMKDLRGAGVGPVFGVAAMPWQNVEVTLLKASFDNRSRYNVQSGVSFFFTPAGTPANSLKQMRRKYLQVDPMVAAGGPYTSPTANSCFPDCRN